MIPFVCSVVGGDAGEDLQHIVVRKEAERRAGNGEFWWGLSASLGPRVEAKAQQNQGTLPALFSKSKAANPISNSVRVWNNWRGVLSPKIHHGRIPNHVIVTSGYDPNSKTNRSDNHYALVCHSNGQLALGSHGFCDLTHCQTIPNRKRIKYLVGARLLEKTQTPLISTHGIASPGCRSIAFEANLIGHCYVKLEAPRVLTQVELDRLRQYRAGDDWCALANSLRS